MASKKTEFEKLNQLRTQSLVGEFWQFIFENKKWWLLPIVLVLLSIGMLMLLAGSGAAPFIYTLF